MIETAVPVRPVPVETVTPIKPSEAIRLGCLIAPVQRTGTFFGREGEACALGAMALGFGWDRDQYGEDGAWSFLDHILPDLTETGGPLRWPRRPGLPADMDLSDSIVIKNDNLGWSREHIADWLEAQGL